MARGFRALPGDSPPLRMLFSIPKQFVSRVETTWQQDHRCAVIEPDSWRAISESNPAANETYKWNVTHMKIRAEVLNILRFLKGELGERYHVRSVALFGSYSRDKQVEGSDIDLLVEFGSGADLFDFAGLLQYLEEKLGSGVDVVPETALRPEIRRQVTRDLLFA